MSTNKDLQSREEFWKVVEEDGSTFYYKDPEHTILHRLDGAAIEYADGSKCWFIEGKRHRLDGAAIEYDDGSKCWFIEGKRHRLDGAAIEYADGSKCWFIEGREYLSEEEYNAAIQQLILTRVERET